MKTNIIKNIVVTAGVTLSTMSVVSTADAYGINKRYEGGSKSTLGYEATFVAGDTIGPIDELGQIGSYENKAEGKAVAYAFNHDKELVYGLASTGYEIVEGRNQGKSKLEMRLLGKTIYKKSFGFKSEMEDPKLKWSKDITIASATYPIGPVGVTVKVGASFMAEIKAKGRIALDAPDGEEAYRPAGYEDEPYLQFQAGPVADIAATAKASVGWGSVASVGVRGRISIYKGGLQGEVDYFPKHNAVVAKVVKESTGIHGSLEAYAEALWTDIGSTTVARFGDSTPRRDILWSSVDPADRSRPVTGSPPPPAPPTVENAARWTRAVSTSGTATTSVTKSETYDVVMGEGGTIKVSLSQGGPKSLASASVYDSSGKLLQTVSLTGTETACRTATLTSSGCYKNASFSLPKGSYTVILGATGQELYTYSFTFSTPGGPVTVNPRRPGYGRASLATYWTTEAPKVTEELAPTTGSVGSSGSSGSKLCEFGDPVIGTTPGCTQSSVGGGGNTVAYQVKKDGTNLVYVAKTTSGSGCSVLLSGQAPGYSVSGTCDNYRVYGPN